MNKNSSKGITLIALIVTIIVLLILAGVTLALIAGDSGTVRKAQNSSKLSMLAEIEESGRLLYNEELINSLKNDEVKMIAIIERLQEKGYTIKQTGVNGNEITGVTLSKDEIVLKQGEEETVSFELATKDGNVSILNNTYYAEVNGKFYELKLNNRRFEVSRNESTIVANDVGDFDIEFVVENTNAGTASLNGMEVTFKSGLGGESKIKARINGTNFEVGTLRVRYTDLEEIRIKTPPTKTSYYLGENFDNTGMVVTAVHGGGLERDITDYTVEKTLVDGSWTSTKVEYTYEGITKDATQEISFKFEKPTVNVSNATSSGFTASYTTTQTVSNPYIKGVKYYVGSSSSDTSATVYTSGTITGIPECTRKYVWAELTYTVGENEETVKSSNYKEVTTGHAHVSSCYTTSETAYSEYTLKYHSNFGKDTDSYEICKARCTACSKVGSAKSWDWVTSDQGDSYKRSRHSGDGACGNYKCIGLNGDWSSAKKRTQYNLGCTNCWKMYYSKNSDSASTWYKCRHSDYGSVLICSKSSSGTIKNGTF